MEYVGKCGAAVSVCAKVSSGLRHFLRCNAAA